MLAWTLTLILFASDPRPPVIGCVYERRDGKGPKESAGELAPQGVCGRVDAEGALHVDAAALPAIAPAGAAPGRVLFVGHGWFLVASSGRTVRVPTWDNGPDEPVDGLVRILDGGKVGWVDPATLEVSIPARYDFGWPFEGGRAKVCQGCAPSAPDADGHRTVDGGEWGYIDRSGAEVVPIRYSREELDGLEESTPDESPIGMLMAPLPDGRELRVESCDFCDACWYLLTGPEQKTLGCGLTNLVRVASISPSPDGRWVAAISVGEGHPILEVIDLEALRAGDDGTVRVSINPYPGTIDVTGWEKDGLRVTSDVPLDAMPGAPDAPMPMPEDFRTFVVEPGSWAVRAATSP